MSEGIVRRVNVGDSGGSRSRSRNKRKRETREPSTSPILTKRKVTEARNSSETSLLLAQDNSFFDAHLDEILTAEINQEPELNFDSEDMFAGSDIESSPQPTKQDHVLRERNSSDHSTPDIAASPAKSNTVQTPSRRSSRRQATTTPRQFRATPRQHKTTPRQHKTTPQQHKTTPQEHKTTPQKPTFPLRQSRTTPRQPTSTPRQPTSTPRQPTSTPRQPTTNPRQRQLSSDNKLPDKSKSLGQVSQKGQSPLLSPGCSGDAEDSQSISSLPPSLLDVRSRALDETLTPKQSQPIKKFQRSAEAENLKNLNLVSENLDQGPFFGLPNRVRELYRDQKGIKELFAWQSECLLSEAVQRKKNLLYSLPTSGGKTLVAEIIMLQELICYKKNCIFVLPYVSLVQEKIRSLAPFALDLGFYLEEYAGPKGRFPPAKRRHKQSLFICTIEKAHSLFNSLVVEKRVGEVGLVVVDEVHMVGEQGRGANLESFLTKLRHINRKNQQTEAERIQIISMSATVGNLKELSEYLDSELYTDSWRPVILEEFVKVGREVYSVNPQEAEQLKLLRRLDVNYYTQAIKQADEDYLTTLVLEVFPEHSCLVFCDSKRRCENVAEMLCRVISSLEVCARILETKKQERRGLGEGLLQEGAGFMCPVLRKTLQFGIAYHHSGLTMDERRIVEEGYLAGTIGVLCCTSTLAAGVNLPARRVIIRSPFMGRNRLSHTQYKQMTGRAGRAGLDTKGESFLMIQNNQVRMVEDVVTAPVEHCISSLHKEGSSGLAALVLNCLFLGLVDTPQDARDILHLTLMNIQAKKLGVEPDKALECALDILFSNNLVTTKEESDLTQQKVELSTPIKPTRLGRAAIQGNINLQIAGRLFSDLSSARPRLAVDTCLHLLFLVTPYDLADSINYSTSVYHKVYFSLPESDLAVAHFVGITESVIVGLTTGRGFPKALKPVLSRFYLALALLDLWQAAPIHEVAHKFNLSRGEVQNLMNSAASFASSVLHFSQEIEEFWAYQELLEPFVKRLAHCCSPELLPLLELPAVKAGRAKQLLQAGFTTLASIARADPKALVEAVTNLSHKAANLIVQSAKLLLIEKAEGLHDEADNVLLEIS